MELRLIFSCALAFALLASAITTAGSDCAPGCNGLNSCPNIEPPICVTRAVTSSPVCSLLAPTTESPVYAGAFTDPHDTIRIELRITDDAGTGIEGLTADRFSVAIGDYVAGVIDCGGTGGWYELDVQPPPQPAPGRYDLSVTIEPGGSGPAKFVEGECVSYEYFNRADAVYLDYRKDAGGVRILETDIVVDWDAPATFYVPLSMAGGSSGGLSYFGIQSEGGLPYERHIHFSGWNQPEGDAVVVGKHPDLIVESFSGEGTGVSCKLPYAWETGKIYRFIVKSRTDTATTDYDYFFEDAGTVIYLGTIRFPAPELWPERASAFLEDFGVHPNCDAPVRSFLISNGFLAFPDGRAVEITGGMAAYNPLIGCMERSVTLGDNWFRLATGNGIVQETAYGEVLVREPTIRITTGGDPVVLTVTDPSGSVEDRLLTCPLDDDTTIDTEVLVSLRQFGIYTLTVTPTGTAAGIYSLTAVSGDSDVRLASENSILPGDVHTYRLESTADGIFDVTGQGTYAIALSPGWNIISLPVSDATLATPPQVVGPTVWEYNQAAGVYAGRSFDLLEPGKGYWVAATAPCVIACDGEPIPGYTLGLERGWNLIGAPGTSVPVSTLTSDPEGSALTGTIFGYQPAVESYTAASELQPGRGYWIPAIRDCVLTAGEG